MVLKKFTLPAFAVLATFALSGALAAPTAASPAPVRSAPMLGLVSAVNPLACGLPVKKPDGSLWKCAFVDQFISSELDTRGWTVNRSETSGAMPAEACWDHDPKNVSVANGDLNLTVVKEDEPFTCKSPYGDFTTQYSGGSVSTWGKFEQTYGRYEIRAKFPDATVPGIHSALWLTPKSQTYGKWPLSGEIDIAEFYSKYPDRAIPYIHYVRDSKDAVTNTQCKLNPREYNNYILEWTPEGILIGYNNRLCAAHRIDPADPLTGSAPFDKPFALVLTQGLGIGQNPFDAETTPLPQTMSIDRVRIWSY